MSRIADGSVTAVHTNPFFQLCRIALERLDRGLTIGDSLLIDNRGDLVEAYRSAGGKAYHFTDDSTFAHDLVSDSLLNQL